MGRRHHYVPKFYLRAFSRDRRRVNLYNLKNERFVFGASLRDQCYVPRFYGRDERVETVLARIEAVAAPLFSKMRDHGAIPGGGTPERDALVFFIGLQLARTTGAQAHSLRMSQLLTEVAFDGRAPERALTPKQSTQIMLSLAPRIATSLADLALTLVTSSSDATFATSDDPVFKYNTYCEGLLHAGVTGTQCKGLQLFFPISPTKLLLLYDAAVYRLVRAGQRTAMASPQDVDQLNRLQLVGAAENVYFEDSTTGRLLGQAASAAVAIRNASRPRIVLAIDDADENSELLHQFWPMPQLDLRLSFITLRPKAQAHPLTMRMRQVRSPYEPVKRYPQGTGEHRRFSVHSEHEPSE